MELKLLKEKVDEFFEEGNIEEAYRYSLEAAMVYNDSDALHTMALLNYYPTLQRGIDYKKAFRFFLLAIKAGEDVGNVMGSIMEDFDKSVKRDVDARDGYRIILDDLMEHDCPIGFIYAGDEYLDTNSVYEPDWRKGIACYERAIELGLDYGYDCIAFAYYNGKAGGVNYQKAYEYYMATDEFHSTEKYYYLGEMYYHGYYVQKDFQKAREYYEGLVNSEIFKDCDDKYVPLAKKRLLEMEE